MSTIGLDIVNRHMKKAGVIGCWELLAETIDGAIALVCSPELERLRARQKEVLAFFDLEVKRRQKEAAIADAARALMRKYLQGGPYWAEMQALKVAFKEEEKTSG